MDGWRFNMVQGVWDLWGEHMTDLQKNIKQSVIGTIKTLESLWYLGYLFLKPRNWKTMGRDDPSASFDGMTYYCHYCHYAHVPTKSIPEREREKERESHQGNSQPTNMLRHCQTMPMAGIQSAGLYKNHGAHGLSHIQWGPCVDTPI